MEYIVIIAVGVLFATILQNVVQSEPVQEAIVEKIRCAILFSGEGCTDPQIASGDTKPAEYSFSADYDPDPSPPFVPTPPVPSQAQANSHEQNLKQPWYECLFSINCLAEEIKNLFAPDEEDLRKEALQHCGQDAECIQSYLIEKKLSAILHLFPGFGGLSHRIEQLTGWNPIDALIRYGMEHPFEAAFTALCIALIPFTGGASAVAGAVGTGATGSILGGLGAAGIAFLGRRLALRFFPRIAAFVASRIPLPPWAARFLPLGMEGGFTATAEQGWFDFIRDGRINWKNALIGGLLGAGIGFAFPVVAPHVADGIGIGLKQIRQLPVAFEVTPDGAIRAKRLGDTGIGRKLEDAGDALRRFAGSGDEVGTLPKFHPEVGKVKPVKNKNGKIVYKVRTWNGEWVTIRNGAKEKVDITLKDGTRVTVPFKSGFPDFTQWAIVKSIKLPKEYWFRSNYVQFRYLNKQLYKIAERNPELRKNFSQRDLEALSSGQTPEGYTWHHHQDPGKMQLVLTKVHEKIGHTGGREIWGGGY